MGKHLPNLALLVVLPFTLAAQSSGADRLAPAALPAVAPRYTPMTANDRWRDYLKRTISPRSFLTSAASAGWGQLRERPHEWKEGGEGYGFRYASSFGEHIVRETLMFGAASAFGEDNRYIRSGESGAKARVEYAVKNTFMARHADGTRHISKSRIVAFAGAALVSRLWQPHSTRSFRSAAVNLATSLSLSTGFEVAREFWPQ